MSDNLESKAKGQLPISPENRINLDMIDIESGLREKLSIAIAGVLEEYGVSGPYLFNVRRDAGYGMKPVESLKDKKLERPLYCLGTGISSVENPERINAI